jgi:hypothetical protein
MPRYQRALVLGCIAFGFLVLLVHAREPIRFNIGDPWSEANVLSSIKYVNQYGFLETSFTDILDVGPLTADSYRYIHYPPLAEITYGAISKYLGVRDIGTFRLFAIGFSGLAMWMLYLYVRRLYNPRVALIATALWSTSLFWLMYGDSMHQTPILQAAAFVALWGLSRAIDTRQRRHYAAAFFGSLACFLASYDHWLFLPSAVLVTIYLIAGNPFARGNRHFVVVCALGCFCGILAKAIFVIGAVGWHEFVADVHFQFLERSTSTFDAKFGSPLSTIVRRITLVFTPFAWISIVYYGIKAIRAPSWTALVKDTAAWMLLVAIAFLWIFQQLAASQMLASEVLMPFYAIGSGILLDRLLAGPALRKVLAAGWFLGACAWSFGLFLTIERSLLDREDVAQTNAYLAEHDHNDFILSNAMTAGHVQAFFERHNWDAPDASVPVSAPRVMLSAFERTGTSYAHALIFTDPASRFIDKSLWPLALPLRQWSVTGWPHLWRAKAYAMIEEADARVMANLEAVGAQRILKLSNFEVYRIDKQTVMERAFAQVPLVSAIDFGSSRAERHKLLGWKDDELLRKQDVPGALLLGRMACPDSGAGNTCKTVLTKRNTEIRRNVYSPSAQFMIRVERACDLRVKVTLASATMLRLAMNGFATELRTPATELTAVIPRAQVQPGVNIVTLENRVPLLWRQPAMVQLVTIDPACE